MKVIYALVGLLNLCIALFANPVATCLLSEVWFADNGHFMIEMHPHNSYVPPADIIFSNGITTAMIPADYQITYNGETALIDASEAMPDLWFCSDEGNLILTMDSRSIDHLTWGSSFSNDISPLLAGQSAVQLWYQNEDNSGTHWTKDVPPTPGTYPNSVASLARIWVIVTNQYGHPVQGAPVYYYDATNPIGYTNADGLLSRTFSACALRVRVKHPESHAEIYNQEFWLEPGQILDIPIQITMTGNEDDVTPVLPNNGLEAYPSPVNLAKNAVVLFTYHGDTNLTNKSMVKLYDDKGRLVGNLSMSSKGTASWQPGKEISSGMYIARLISGNRILDTTTISIIK